jgi:Tol biopolymer transport system component
MRLAILLCLLTWSALAQSGTAGVKLEAGIAKEEVDGDLKSAIEVYQKIAADSSAPRDVRAKALLRLAGCYEKLGRQARQLYEQIVRDYSDQPAASQARTRLASLKQQEHTPAPATMGTRMIETSALRYFGETDTDGQRAVYRGSDGNLYFGDLAGHTKRLVFKAQSGDEPGWRPSRDFSEVYLQFLPKPNHPAILAVVRTDSTGYRELIRDSQQQPVLEDYFDAAWSWDNRFLLVWSRLDKGGGHLFVVSVADGHRRELLSIETGRFNNVAFSPDGRFIAYEVAPSPGQGNTSRVFVVPSQGGQPQLAYESAPSYKPVWGENWTLRDWTADGRYLIIADARAGRAALYLLPIKNGVSTGAQVFIRFGECDSGFSTAGGAFVYRDRTTAASSNVEAYLGSLNADGALSGWRRLAIRDFDMYVNPMPSFSPDGSHVAYIAKDEDPAFRMDLVLQNLSDGNERVLYRSHSELLFCQYATQHPKIFCTEVKETEGKEEKKTDLLAIAVESGRTERLASWRGVVVQGSRDDQALYLAKFAEKGEEGSIVRWDLATHQETAVSAAPLHYGVDWSFLDNRWLVRLSQKLSIRPLSGGDWKPVVSLASGPNGHVTCTPDGNWLIYHSTDPAGKHVLFRVPISGGQPQSLGSFPTESSSGNLNFSPDGRQILAVSLDWSKYDLWILNNFVPSAGKQ